MSVSSFLLRWFFWAMGVPGWLMAQPLPETHAKHRVARQVLAGVAASFGSARPQPSLVVHPARQTRRVIARCVANRIEIDETLYDLCRSFGKDSLAALACVLGHELAHYYRNHAGTESFSALLASAPGPDTRALEAEADYYGVFHGFMAGYDTHAVVTRLYDRIYRAYRLPESMPGYPSRAERIALAQAKLDETRPLAQVVQSGTWLLLKGEPLAAARLFGHVLESFPVPELYNNTGVGYLAEAIRLFPDHEVPFAYPFELDPVNRLLSGGTRGEVPAAPAARTALLAKAEECFQRAVQLDGGYAPAYINLSLAQTLSEVPLAAVGTLELLARRTAGRQPPNAHLARGIALAKAGRPAEAAGEFEQARRRNAFRAAYNQDVFRKTNASAWDAVAGWIHAYFAPAPAPAGRPQPDARLLVPGWPAASVPTLLASLPAPGPVQVHEEASANALRVETTAGQVQFVSAPAAGAPWVGRNVADWLRKFAEPDLRRAAPGCEYYVYRQARLLLEVRGAYIAGWTVWRTL